MSLYIKLFISYTWLSLLVGYHCSHTTRCRYYDTTAATCVQWLKLNALFYIYSIMYILKLKLCIFNWQLINYEYKYRNNKIK